MFRVKKEIKEMMRLSFERWLLTKIAISYILTYVLLENMD